MKHLKCLLEELKLLEEVLDLAPSKNLNTREIKDSMDNIKRIVLELQVKYYYICSPGNKINGRAF